MHQDELITGMSYSIQWASGHCTLSSRSSGAETTKWSRGSYSVSSMSRKEKLGSATCWKHPWKKKEWLMALKTADHNRVMRLTYSTDFYRERLNTAWDPDTLRSQANHRAVSEGPFVQVSLEYDFDDMPLHTYYIYITAVILQHSLMTLFKTKMPNQQTKENEKERTDTITASSRFSLKKQPLVCVFTLSFP